MDYYEFLWKVLGEYNEDGTEKNYPPPWRLMSDYDPDEVFKPGDIEVVDEEQTKSGSPTWKIFKVKDSYFRIDCHYDGFCGYDINYRFQIVTPHKETVEITRWHNE